MIIDFLPGGSRAKWASRHSCAGFGRAVPVMAGLALALSVAPLTASTISSPLTINATFDTSITSDPNAAAIEASINTAISFYTSNLTTATVAPIDVTIKFQEGGGLGSSATTLYKETYQSFIDALIAASSDDLTDTTALAGLPTTSLNPVTGSAFINIKTAPLRALGYTGAPPSGGFDGIITVNTALTHPGSTNSSLNYNLMSVVSHEIDEILGLGSDLGQPAGFFDDPAPEDLFRFDSSGHRSYTTSSSAHAYFALSPTSPIQVEFDNQNDGGDWGDWAKYIPNTQGSPVVRVQDAFATPGSNPFLTLSSPEIQALDAIGYNLVVPEPGTLFLSAIALSGLFLSRRPRRNG